jgi:hypothetical protein
VLMLIVRRREAGGAGGGETPGADAAPAGDA